MGNLGIGLGGFASGFEKGIGLGDKLHKMGKERDLDDSTHTAVADATAKTEAGVADGSIAPDQAGRNTYLLTANNLVAPLLKAGETDKAAKMVEQMQTAQAQDSMKAWTAGAMAAESGDAVGGLKGFLKAAQIGGLGSGFSDPVALPDGRARVTYKSGGQTLTKDLTVDEVKLLGAKYNPTLLVAGIAARQKDEQEVATLERTLPMRTAAAVATHEGNKKVDLANAPTETDNFLKRFEGQKKIETQTKVAEQAEGLGGNHFDLYNRTETDENGKQVVRSYRYDRRSGKEELIQGEGAMTRGSGSGAGGGRKTDFDKKMEVGARLFPGDERAAADWANGKKPLSEADIQKFAIREANDLYKHNPTKRKQAQEEIANGLREINRKPTEQPAGITPKPVATEAVPRPAAQRPDQMTPGNGNKPVDVTRPTPPAGVPPNAGYSPATGMWFTREGKKFDKDGKQVQ